MLYCNLCILLSYRTINNQHIGKHMSLLKRATWMADWKGIESIGPPVSHTGLKFKLVGTYACKNAPWESTLMVSCRPTVTRKTNINISLFTPSTSTHNSQNQIFCYNSTPWAFRETHSTQIIISVHVCPLKITSNLTVIVPCRPTFLVIRINITIYHPLMQPRSTKTKHFAATAGTTYHIVLKLKWVCTCMCPLSLKRHVTVIVPCRLALFMRTNVSI